MSNDTNDDFETSSLENAPQQHIPDPQKPDLEDKILEQQKLIDTLKKGRLKLLCPNL